MMRNKILFSLIIIGVFFILFSALGSADLYLNSKVGTIYFNTTGVARASIGPGGNFSINTSDFFVNTNLGRVGINTNNPSSKLNIHVGNDDGLKITNSGSSLNIVSLSGGRFAINHSSASDNQLVFRSGGAIGVNELNPTSNFSVKGSVAIGSSTFSTASAPANGLIVEGNVGIGTTTPSNKLDVRGVINASSDIYFNNGTKVGLGNLSGGGNAGYIPQWKDGVTLNDSVIYTSGGFVGINTTNPNASLQVGTAASSQIIGNVPLVRLIGSGNNETAETILRLNRKGVSGVYYPATVDFNMRSFDPAGSPYGPGTQLDIALKATGSWTETAEVNVLTLRDDGNVGIGTSNPEATLDIYKSYGGTSQASTRYGEKNIIALASSNSVSHYGSYVSIAQIDYANPSEVYGLYAETNQSSRTDNGKFYGVSGVSKYTSAYSSPGSGSAKFYGINGRVILN